MVPRNPVSRRQKITLYYTLAILIPGIVLGYLAYRGILNDQALREKESRRNLERISQNFFAAIDSSLVHFMKTETTDSMPNPGKVQNPALLATFVKGKNRPVRLISHQLLYLPADLMPVKSEQTAAPTYLETGSRLEYNEQKFPEALRFYLGKIAKTNNPVEEAEAMIAAARLYRKLNRPVEAKALYEEILQKYPGDLLKGQMPLGLIAGLELLKIDREAGDEKDLRKNSIEFLMLLLHPKCSYDENQFNLFYQSGKEIIPKTDSATDSLFSDLALRKAQTECAAGVLDQQEQSNPAASESFILDRNGTICSPVNSNGINALLLSRHPSGGNLTAVIIDFAVYLKSKSEGLIKSLDPNTTVNLNLEDNNGQELFPKVGKEEPGYSVFPFPDHLPSWKLLLKENKPGFIASLLLGGSIVYLLLFLLIVLLMILGFTFSIYTLNEELRLNRLKSEFISNVSHELKSPLTAIRMMTEMLHHKRVESEERKATYYSVMLEESEHLSQLIDNILDFSRIEEERKKYNFLELDLNQLLLEFLKSSHERLPSLDFMIKYSCPENLPLIRADKNALLQVVNNLFDNAIKFSCSSRIIEINLSCNEEVLRLCIKDFGIGIPPKDQDKIFNRFYRGDEPQKLGIKGSGIGLTIVKKIVEAHKGWLTLESNPGKGTTFCVHLPVINDHYRPLYRILCHCLCHLACHQLCHWHQIAFGIIFQYCIERFQSLLIFPLLEIAMPDP